MSDPDLDNDLRSVHQARSLAARASAAQERLEGFDQERVDAIVEAMAAAGLRESRRLARMAHEETGYGNVDDKVAKNDFVLEKVTAAMRSMRTVGILRHDRRTGVMEIAEPVGVVAGIIPSTNPTSTAMFKCLIALKARCGIVLSPHPAARECIRESADVMSRAAVGAGAPGEVIGCMSEVTLDGTHELMGCDDVDLILATGGMGLVKAAYSAGKPAYGVGPGNVPAYIHESADVATAVRDVFSGTTFDYGTLCSSEQSIVCDAAIRDEVVSEIETNGGRILSPDEVERLSSALITEEYLVNPDLVGRPATEIAAATGIDVPSDTTVLVCPLDGAGKQYPLSHEKLSPVLAFYEVEDWREGCERCTELLRFGGMGHTLTIHSEDREVIRQFGLQKPAHRICVNTVAAVGAVGLTTNLFPSMTLGCGSWGNNITSDNVGPQHLINVKRLAHATGSFLSQPMRERLGEEGMEAAEDTAAASQRSPEIVAATAAEGDDDPLVTRVSEFLERRGVVRQPESPPAAGLTTAAPTSASRAARAAAEAPGDAETSPACGCPEPPRGRDLDARRSAGDGSAAAELEASGRPATEAHEGAEDELVGRRPGASGASPSGTGPTSSPSPAQPVEFVSELDVRTAIDRGERIPVGPETIVTPLARELAEDRGVFRHR